MQPRPLNIVALGFTAVVVAGCGQPERAAGRQVESNDGRSNRVAPSDETVSFCGQQVSVHAREVRCSDPELRSLEPLRALTHLEVLAIDPAHVIDLSPLAVARSLRELWIAENPVETLAPIENASRLEEVNLRATRVADLRPLYGARKLRRLNVSGTPVTTFEAPWPELTEIDISQTSISDLGPLAALGSLEFVSVYNTPVEDLRPLGGLEHLESLDARSTRVTQLPSLKRMVSLKRLSVSSLLLTDLSPLAGARSLWKIDFAYTLVTDVSPLAGIATLAWIDLSGTLVAPSSVAALRKSLPAASITFRPFAYDMKTLRTWIEKDLPPARPPAGGANP